MHVIQIRIIQRGEISEGVSADSIRQNLLLLRLET